MANNFDEDPLGAVLEFGVLHKAHPPPVQKRAAWESANIRSPSGGMFAMPPQVWLNPAITRTQLEGALEVGRKRDEVRRTLERVFRTMEHHNLVDIYAPDDNPATRYRVVTPLGAELVVADAHREYVGGLGFVVKRWSDSVVCLVGKGGIGTGFLISRRHIATARHVLDQQTLTAIKKPDGSEVSSRVTARLVPKDEDSDLDVAILELEEDVPAAAPLRLAVDRALLDEVVVFGFPPVSAAASGPHLHVNRGEISSEFTLDNGLQAILITCLLRGGYSGGPVLNRRGEVVGLVSNNLYNRLPRGERDINESLGSAALVPAEWIGDLAAGRI